MAKRKKRDKDTVVQDTAPEGLDLASQDGEDRERDQERAIQVELLDPYEIQAPLELNTRRFQTTRESIVSLAISMLEDGQQEPVMVRRTPDGANYLVWGFRRWQAAVLIGDEHLSETPYKLQAIVVPSCTPAGEVVTLGTDVAGLVAGVVENTQRVGLGPLDEAYAIQRMKAAGMNQAAIARKMAVSQATVTQRLKLLDLPVVVQKRVNLQEVVGRSQHLVGGAKMT
jgi:ParB-like chromosome segregation protein Spo0J